MLSSLQSPRQFIILNELVFFCINTQINAQTCNVALSRQTVKSSQRLNNNDVAFVVVTILSSLARFRVTSSPFLNKQKHIEFTKRRNKADPCDYSSLILNLYKRLGIFSKIVHFLLFRKYTTYNLTSSVSRFKTI